MHYPSAQTCQRHVLLEKTQDSRVLIIQRGTSTETTAQSARGGGNATQLEEFYILYRRRIILTSCRVPLLSRLFVRGFTREICVK